MSSTEPSELSGEHYNLETSGNLRYNFFPNDSGHLQFKIRAANNAFIVLSSQAAAYNPIYEVFIGISDNTKSMIRRGNKVVEQSTPNILCQGNTREFWIRWNNGTITVGHENNPDPFMSFTDDCDCEPINVTYVGVSTGGVIGVWIVKVAGNGSAPGNLDLETSGNFRYNFFPNNSGVIHFKVKAKSDIFIALCSQSVAVDPMYEVLIDSPKSIIRKNRDHILFEQSTPEILSKYEFRGFWIRWQNRTITAGHENMPYPFMSWTDFDCKEITVTYVGVCTREVIGEWIVQNKGIHTPV